MKKWILALIIVGVLAYCLYAQPGPIQPVLTNLTQFVNQTAWRVFYSNTDGDVTELALGANGTFLQSNGASSAPTWEAAAGGGDITSVWDDTTGAVTQPVIGSGEFLDGGTATSDAAGEGILLPRANDVSGATAEGQISWDADNDLLYVGDGAAVVSIAGGATAYDDISDPDASGSISFDDTETATYTTVQDTAGSFISFINSNADVSNQVYMLDLDYSADTTQDNADFIRLQDAGSTLVVFEEEGKITMTPSGIDDAIIISVIPSAVLSTNEAVWKAISINGAALDPSGNDVMLVGVGIDFSGVAPTGTGEDIDGTQIKMASGEEHAIHIEEGKVVIDNTAGADAGAEYTVVDIRLDISSLHANSEIHGIDVAVETGTPAGKVVAVGTHTNVNPISQNIGVFSTPDQAGADSEAGFFDDSGTDYIDGVDGIEQFTADDDAIWISAATVFTELEVNMGTPATRSITPTFWYWKDLGVDAWTQFFPADDTDGFQQSGTIRWETSAVPDWLSADVVNISAGDAGEAAAGYWIAIIRTVNADPGAPTPTTVKTGDITEFSWDETGAIDVLSMEADTITEGGNAVYSSGETPSGELGGTYANISIDDSVAVTSWNLTTPTITTSLTTSTPKTIAVAELDRLDGLAGIIVTDVTAVTDIEGTGLSIGGATLNWSAASTDLTDTADLLYEAELDDFSELQAQISDKTLVNTADGATWLGIHTFGGATTVIPWKVNTTAAPTVEGQAIWESDTDELTVGDSSVSVVIAAKINTVFCFNIHDIDSGMDDIKMPFTRATTITKVTAFVTAGTNVVGRLYEVDGDGDDADAVGVEAGDWTFTAGETEDSSFNNATFDAGDYIQWDTTSVSGSVTGFMISVEGYEI